MSSCEEGVMSVGDGGQGVDLEVFVRSTGGHRFDWSPVGEGWLSIIEPLVAEMLHVVVIDVRNSLGDLTSWKSTTKLQHVGSNISIDGCWSLSIKKGVVKMVSSTDNLNIIDVMTVDSWQANTAVVHLSGEDFVTEEVVSENTTVRVSEIVRVSSSDIWKVSKH